MNRRRFIRNGLGGIALLPMGSVFNACNPDKEEYYIADDFASAPKVDAHVHYDTFNEACLKYASTVNMHLLTVNVDAGEPLDRQLEIAQTLKRKYPEMIDFLGTFSVEGFGTAAFAGEMLAQVKACIAAGARGIKIWKNIGMALRDADGKYVMADHPAFDPLYAWLEKEGLPMTAHLGEPRNCWLPLEQITMGGDLNYYTNHPEYYMYNHPDAPSYDEQIAARDHVLEKFPRLQFVGAHIGSQEWSLDEAAARFEKYPCFYVDLAARIGHVQLQALQDRKKVRDFFIRYQDRILYGSDATLDDHNTQNAEERCRSLFANWKKQWMFFATGETEQPVDRLIIPDEPDKIEGLQLPKKVVDKIFGGNCRRLFC